MYKRALMLTAATVALLSGPAFGAADDIKTKVTTPLNTTDNGPITLDTGGSIVIPSSSSVTAATAAVTLNSTTPANNIFTSVSGTTLSYDDTLEAIGILAKPNLTGEIVTGGTIDLTGGSTGKDGIFFGDPTLATTGTFTGVADSTNNAGRVTALYVDTGSDISVQGDGSSDIVILSGNSVTGDIVVAGALTDEPTSLTAVTNSIVVTAINLQGSLTGNLDIAAGGTITATGANAQGVVDLGVINGSILNFGSIETVGTTTAKTTGGNPEAGSALIISNNVTGGIYNAGPGNGDSVTVRAVISSEATVPAVDITPNAVSTATIVPITIGGYMDPDGVFGNVSFLNRGAISGTPQNADSSSSAIAISGVSSTDGVTLSNGLVNAGSIASSTTTDTKSVATSSQTTALSIGNFVTINGNTGPSMSYGSGDAIVNSNESGAGTISATVGGVGAGSAIAINIGSTTTGSGTSVESLYNSGTISASATTSDPTISILHAFAILDNSGSLLSITNTGTISATSTTLNNFTNVSDAISLQEASNSATITNSGTINGDILLGQYGDTVSVTGISSTSIATINGNIFFGGNASGGGFDTLKVNADSEVTGNILAQGSDINVIVANSGILNVTNNGTTINNLPLSDYVGIGNGNLTVSNLEVDNDGTLGLTLAQAFNQQSNSSNSILPVVQGSTADGGTGAITLNAGSILNLNFGSFVSPNNLGTGGSAGTSRFVIFDAPSGKLIIAEPQTIINDITKDIPFLFNGSVCGYGISNFTGASACTGADAAPEGSGRSDLVLDLTPKAAGVDPATGGPDAGYLGLTGYAAKMFPLANQALANDTTLGAAVVAAGDGLTGADIPGQGQKIYQGIYSAFAPDVTGASRAIAISLTDQATGAVGARQRALRMYAGLDGDATLWGQEFGTRLNTGNSVDTTGYSNTGFGFALGADSGDPHDGRYGAAFTFYSGTTSEKAPRTSKTRSEWAMLTGYSDWRGHGLFFDSQISAGYGQMTGHRSIVIDDEVAKCNGGAVCTAEGKRDAALLAGGVTAGTIYHAGGTVFIPQISLDGMTMREEGYTESTPNLVSQATSGFDLHVKPYYAESLRAFAGADLRQDLKFGDYFVQPEGRAGIRYDFLDGAEKLKAEFACSAVATGGCGDTSFTITGPDPAKANFVLGGGLAVTTGAWSLGLNYDFIRGIDGVKNTDQEATFTLIGRI